MASRAGRAHHVAQRKSTAAAVERCVRPGGSNSETTMKPNRLTTAEELRLTQDTAREKNWKRWGPYLSERQWATVREDYWPWGNCWDYFPHDHARSRAYRWGEDGLLGITDRQCRLCLLVRFIQGLGAAALSTVSITLVAHFFSKGRERHSASITRLKAQATSLRRPSVDSLHTGLASRWCSSCPPRSARLRCCLVWSAARPRKRRAAPR